MPVSTRFQAERETGFIEPRFEPVQCIGIANRFSNHREIPGIAFGHRGKHRFHGRKRIAAANHLLTDLFGDYKHG